jgi:glycosyltransferase involved in cell wall biosynthesis
MRIAILTDNDFGKVNGVTTTLKAVLRYAPPDLRLRVFTACREEADTPEYRALVARGIPIPCYREMEMFWPGRTRLKAEVQRFAPSVLHLTTPGPIGLVALHIQRALRLPMVGSFHTDLAAYAHLLTGSRAAGRVMAGFLRWPYGKCEHVLAPSEATRQLLLAGRGRAADSVSIWRRGVDTSAYAPVHRSAALRESWGVSDARPAVLYVGRVSKEKGLDLLAPLTSTLSEAGHAHRLVVVGEGPYLDELRRVLPDAVFTGVLGGAALAEAYASADIFAFPSATDTAGNVVLEAQSSGLPVLVTNRGGPQENLDAGTSGLVLPAGDVSAWARALGPMISDNRRRQLLGHGARAYAERRSWHEALAPLYGWYRLLASQVPRISSGHAWMTSPALSRPQHSSAPASWAGVLPS